VLAAPPPGAAGLLGIDNLASLEPARWPTQYSVAMRIRGQPPARYSGLVLRFNPASADLLFEGSGHTYRELLDLWNQGKPLPNFALPSRLRASLHVEESDLESPNLIAALEGSDPALRNEYLVLSAHLDGYGLGEPWGNDRIYNGAFDDAAYVAGLLDLADRIHDSKATFRRSIIFAIFTGEEKGLLGSRYFTQHLTVPREQVVANLNLDQVRPLFPLNLMTVIALDESTLGETIRQVAGPMDITIQPDSEPWRNLMRRADNFNFMQIGVPATGFVLAPRKGTSDEAIYKEWYARRYHTPLDDLKQPWDPSAAARFNNFFEKLVAALANAPDRPQWRPGSEYAIPRN
jgi:Zn-dependent M28 family amino/carboxypeptidase